MSEINCEDLLKPDGPTALIVRAKLEPIAGLDRFQPAGFPEVGHVIYKAPRTANATEDVCIVDSPASMANHLEAVCFFGPGDSTLHPDLTGLPHVACVTDKNYTVGQTALDPKDSHDRLVCTTLTEGHRLASDYFLDGLLDAKWAEEKKIKGNSKGKGKEKTVPAHWEGTKFRTQLRREFEIVEVKEDEKYFVYPENWWAIYKTIFKYDPNSLIHGVLFAKEQIKISRFLTAHLEAFGAARVGRSGVKFDRLGKTVSGQPIFAVDEETAKEIRATFILDLALLRSYGRGEYGLSDSQKLLLLELAIWKIKRLLDKSFRYRTQCWLKCSSRDVSVDDSAMDCLPEINVAERITAQKLPDPVTSVYYPADKLFKVSETKPEEATEPAEEPEPSEAEPEE
ncbi:MAG: type I-G CRISPR-associated protein Cas7 [Terriglobia bacterium]